MIALAFLEGFLNISPNKTQICGSSLINTRRLSSQDELLITKDQETKVVAQLQLKELGGKRKHHVPKNLEKIDKGPAGKFFATLALNEKTLHSEKRGGDFPVD